MGTKLTATTSGIYWNILTISNVKKNYIYFEHVKCEKRILTKWRSANH